MSAARQETPGQLLRRAIAMSAAGRSLAALGSPGALEGALGAVLAASAFLAAVPALHAYQVAGAPVEVAAAAAASTLLAFLGARVLRLRAYLSYGLSLVGLILLLVAAVGPHAGVVARELAHGPNRILTETLPLSGGRAAVSALVVLVWVCGAATAETIIRTALTRARVPFALAIPLLLYVLCYAVSSAAPVRDRIAGPVLLVALSVAAAIRHQLTTTADDDPDEQVRPPSRYRAAATGVASSIAAAAVLAAVAPAVPALANRPALVHRRPPTVIPVITDPVDSMGQLRDGHPRSAPTPLLSASISGPSTGYLAMAYLDEYDGGQWRFTGTFQPTGSRVPSLQPPAPLSSRTVSQRISITAALPAPLLPALDRPVSIRGVDAVTDPVTGMLLPQSGHGLPTYTVVSHVPVSTLADLPAADGIDTSLATPADLAIPPNTSTDLATTLRFLSTLAGGQRPAATVGFLQTALETLQSKEKRIDPTLASGPAAAGAPGRGATTTTSVPPGASGGTSLSGVINAVTVNRAATPEQFATFYAMTARYLGVPARVVTGFRLAGGSTGGSVAAGTYQVTNRQAWAWVEVPVAGLGWVVCDPTPDSATGASTAPPETVSAPATTLPPRQANVVPRNQIVGGHALAPPGHITVARHTVTSPWLYVGLGVAGLVLAVILGGPGQAALRRYWRRRRRRARDPVTLAVGAWLEMLDGLDRAGMRAGPGATASEVADEVGHHFGPELVPQAAAVATTADRAVFSVTVPVSAEAAQEAWDAAHDVCRKALSGLDVRQRLRSSLLVGSAPSRPSRGGRE